MKKIVMIAVLSIVSAMSTFAQFSGNRASLEFVDDKYIGFRIGPSFTGIAGDAAEGGTAKVGLSVGVVCGFPLSDTTPLFLESGLFYQGKGENYDEGGADLRCRMDYLEIPVVFKYSYEMADKFALQPLFGGYFGYGIGGKAKDFKQKTPSQSTFSVMHLNRFDAGLKFGVGAQYDLFYAELAYNIGLVNISRYDYVSAHNSAFTINFGVNF